MASRILQLVVLISGSGRTLQNLIDRSAAGTLKAKVLAVVSSKDGVPGLDRARAAGIPTHVVARDAFPTDDLFSAALCETIDRYPLDYVCMAGFLHFWLIPERYQGKVINIHPALLPRHGGRGFFGERVHRAVIEAGDRESGCTVHFADNEYDHGPILLQRQVPVLPGDTAATLSRRVFLEECRAYPEALTLLAQNKVKLENGKVTIDYPEDR